MSSRYLDMVRGRVTRPGAFTARTGLLVLAIVGSVASAAFWWSVQSVLTDQRVMAVAMTAIMVVAPPGLLAFLLPMTPAGQLLMRVNGRTWGYTVLMICALFLLWYSFQMMNAWWQTQRVVRDSGYVLPQVIVCLIGFVIIPALLWQPVTTDELVEQIRQAQLVKRYEMQTQADIALLRATLLRAQEKALIGFANLTVEERAELAAIQRGLVRGIGATMQEIAHSVKTVSGATVPFASLDDNADIKGYLDAISETLGDTTLATRTEDRSSGGERQPSATRR